LRRIRLTVNDAAKPSAFAKLAEMLETANGSTPNTLALLPRVVLRVRAETPSLTAVGAAILSALLLILSFPDFNLWPLAWISIVPLLITIAWRPQLIHSFLLGWITGSIFFYGSCYWLTFSMINYGGIPPLIAYVLLIPGALTLGLFPALFALGVSASIRSSGQFGILIAPLLWPGLEWARLGLTGQLWNALGYSLAYQPVLIQPAKWGGVYAVSFLIVVVNCSIALALVERRKRSVAVTAILLISVAVVTVLSGRRPQSNAVNTDELTIVALQPNVPMTLVKSAQELQQLTDRHLRMSEEALNRARATGLPILVVWPESPMYFEYARDSEFQSLARNFVQQHDAALLFNSQEPAPNNGNYNSAMLMNEDGRVVGQYDKIRLLPFGEYVPIPRWLPLANLITAIVGDFTPGANYTIFRVHELKLGVFICVESAYPSIARAFAEQNVDVLINISNDGYLGPTAVMKQHLANAVFRAVENGKPVVRVTNTGITAYITPEGGLNEATEGFEEATRVWSVPRSQAPQTFYTRNGDLFVLISAAVAILLFLTPLMRRRVWVRS
jgi:apolipoprotein N-acyltransferase